MGKYFFIKLASVLLIITTVLVIYRIHVFQSKITNIYKYSEIQIPLNNKITQNDNALKNISIKDENNNNIDTYVFLSASGKTLMINPPIDGFYENSKILITINKNDTLYFKVKTGNSITLSKSIRKPEYGDIIGTTGRFMGYEYDHYGIYVGNNKVIHYCSSTGNAKDAEIQETDMEPYFKEKNYFILNIKGTVEFNSYETVKRAETRLGEKSYNLLQNNCEHFVIWAKTGNSESLQLENLSEKELVQVKMFTAMGINLQ
ncbi:lecithin retinol acyltransferase family protein [Clostridium sp. WILCCON 0269]|uniref:Lecithin retinol acyltransferase family protein n=1 Tax=Candidatus Clostridium eludens TaxID=3381663 RepID=A0ABW8SHT9_9CLOT